MKKKTFSILILCLLLTLVIPGLAFGQTSMVVGDIDYFEGRVNIHRNGQLLDWRTIDFGFPIEQFDLIETGPDSMVELSLRGPVSGSSRVIIRPNTAFSLEHVETTTEQQSVYQVMRGSIGVQSSQRAPNEGLRVRSATTAMGVRGTTFDVTVAVEGSILISVSSGLVEVEDDRGRKANAQPGTVVQRISDQPPQRTAVSVEDLGLYQDFWVTGRIEAFRAGAPTFIQAFARQHREYYPRFQNAYNQLLAQRNTLERFGQANSTASMGSLIQAKTQVTPAIVAMRSILPLFEMTFFRLVDLEEYHAEGFGRTTIEPGLSSDAFFRTFAQDARQVNTMLAVTRYLFKLYAQLHEATGGGPSLLDSPFGTSPLAPPNLPGSPGSSPAPTTPGSGLPGSNLPGSTQPGSSLPGGTFRPPGN